ncbi:hypothetical protein FVE85_8144 [Porphyridium purpureum]|uniref:Uncharacterized protein n=1 Tax=Porphyridium purpureum TaxID=35688 RepID=A0A5J4YQG9_PORPP|nr:hypothetical protein FVE85_8144 [Porphyridium purpureum]|eukprot:POR6526..scf295_9
MDNQLRRRPKPTVLFVLIQRSEVYAQTRATRCSSRWFQDNTISARNSFWARESIFVSFPWTKRMIFTRCASFSSRTKMNANSDYACAFHHTSIERRPCFPIPREIRNFALEVPSHTLFAQTHLHIHFLLPRGRNDAAAALQHLPSSGCRL